MATKTVAAGGGNFNAGSTWVGGVQPLANDDIVANATSGNLTLVTNTVNLIGANFTGYTGTLALSNSQLNLTSGSTITLSSTMTITNTGTGGRFQFANPGGGGGTIAMTGGGICRVPNIQMVSSGTLTISGSGQLYLGGVNQAMTTNGNDFTFYGTAGPTVLTTVTSPQFCFIRPDTTLTLSNLPFSRMVFDTTASVTTTGSILSTFTSNTYIRFDKSPAFSAGVPISYLTSVGSLTHTLDVATSSVKITRLNMAFNSANLTTTIYLPTDTNIGKMMLTPYFNSSNNTWTTRMLSGSNISVDELVLRSDYGSFTGAAAEGAGQVVITGSRNNTLRLSSGATWSITSLNSSGVSAIGVTTPSTILASWTASVPATISIGNTFSFDNTQIIDIDNVGTPAYAFTFANNTLTRTTGITSTVPSGGTGGSGGSFTFVS
jgi:hypothetical protein